MKEKSICFSSGLKVIDSSAPLIFLSDPDPMKSLYLVKSVNPPTLNNPVLSYAAADVAVDPPKVKSIPSPSGGITNVLSDPVPVKENRSCLSSGLNVILSAAPENFLSEPDPKNALVLSVSAIPVIGILPLPK